MMFETWMQRRLQSPLPGVEAHERFVPDIPDRRSRLMPAPATARRSAVLVPLMIDRNEQMHVMLTVRSEGLRNHKGQISFPGGRCEDGEDAIAAALREAHEEVGIAPEQVRVLGELTGLYIPPSHSAVTPVLGIVHERDAWTLNADEVAEVLIEPIASFLDPSSVQHRADIITGVRVDVPHWRVHPTIPLWGATAMMLHELVMILHEYQSETV